MVRKLDHLYEIGPSRLIFINARNEETRIFDSFTEMIRDFETVTVALGMTAPDGSVTVPWIVAALPLCAAAAGRVASKSAAAGSIRKNVPEKYGMKRKPPMG